MSFTPTFVATGAGARMSAEPCILLLRGVNVGAHRVLPMADLRAILTGLGCAAVQTHIQSGNAVFRANSDGLAARIAEGIGARFPFTPRALVLPVPAYRAILAACPFAGEGVHVGFLAEAPELDTAPLQTLAAPDEGLALTPTAFYLHAPSGIGWSKLAARAEALLGVPMTMRNLRVATAILKLAEGL